MSRARAIRRSLLGVAVALALPGIAAAATFGANVGGLFVVGQTPTIGTLAKLQALRATGATVARSDSFWETAEPRPPVSGVHTFNWNYDDDVVSAISQSGLRWQPILDYATHWAGNGNGGSNPGVAPGYLGDYAAYAAAFAARYGQGGTFWTEYPGVRPEPVNVFEIWNEPDSPMFWGPAPDLAEYATMFLQARAAIKAVDPGAKVIIGGLVYPRESLPALIAARPDLRGNVDGVGVHPYRSTLELMMASVANDLASDQATVGAPLYVNEFGWSQPGLLRPDDTEAVRDGNTGLATELLGRDPYVADVEPYCWGCRDAYDLYGTPAAQAFAAGVGAAQTSDSAPQAAPSTATATTPVYVRDIHRDKPLRHRHKPKRDRKPRVHRKHHRHHHQRHPRAPG